MHKFVTAALMVCALLMLAAAPAAAQDAAETLVVYSGRNETLIAPILARFTEVTGVQVQVVYGDTAAVANQILEEGANSPADVYIGQDAGALGALAKAGALSVLPADVLERVPSIYASTDGYWVGLSARARVLVYNPTQVAVSYTHLLMATRLLYEQPVGSPGKVWRRRDHLERRPDIRDRPCSDVLSQFERHGRSAWHSGVYNRCRLNGNDSHSTRRT